MKKTNLYILIGAGIFFLGLFILKPLSGNIYTKMDAHGKEVPSDPISQMMLLFSKEVTAKPISFEGIDHVIFYQEKPKYELYPDKYYTIFNISGDSSSYFQLMANTYRQQVRSERKGNTLSIILGPEIKGVGEIHLDTIGIKSIQFHQVEGNLTIENIQQNKLPIDQLILTEGSDIRFSTSNSRDDNPKIQNLNLLIKERSKVNIIGYAFNRLQAQLNNGFLGISNEALVDSLSADLQGKSHVFGIKKIPEGKIKYKNITGDLTYYDSH